MSTHKYIDRICAAAAALCLIMTLLFVNGEALGVQSASQVMGYEAKLFDTSRVHTIEIVMDGWDRFLETCENEEYAACSVVIDNEAYKNVGIRAKGNTSLSSVSRMGSDRYSFKLEFDQYDNGKTYYGLDKLCLNNLIQDNTMMKDYLTYRLMGEFGVAAPLCSYVYITVNGEDWGLYLAVEGVEDAFLQRNYGRDHGALYKPDSMSFGGGRGNGRDFEMDGGGQAGGVGRPAQQGAEAEGFNPSAPGGAGAGSAPAEGTARFQMPSMGSSDVKLQYSGDSPDGYSNIFDSAKTTVSDGGKARLIEALKALGEGDAEAALDMDQVLRYFVVHNFVVNGDSYTGDMVHNYYLYEAEGRLSMIPWDYNLAFGTFQGGDAAGAVNDPIDTPLRVAGDGDRPMADWMFGSEGNTALYHQYFQQFLDSVDCAAIIQEAYTLIAPYVERDPTKFCTSEEFEAGVEALRAFCALRIQSVSGQLAGTIPSTDSGQEADSAALVDATGLTLSDMGTMDNGSAPAMGGGFLAGGFGGGEAGEAAGELEGGGFPGADGGERQPPEGVDLPGGFPGGLVESGPAGASGVPEGTGGPALALLGASVLVLLAGLAAAFRFRRFGEPRPRRGRTASGPLRTPARRG